MVGQLLHELGFSLQANTHLHANEEQGLERLCRYGARGALVLERLSRAEDGRIAYRMKRPLPDCTTHLLFTGLELLRRVASLVPAPWANLTRFHGVFAPGAKLRPFLVPQAEETSAGSEAAAKQERMKERTPRVDWAELLKRTFDFEDDDDLQAKLAEQRRQALKKRKKMDGAELARQMREEMPVDEEEPEEGGLMIDETTEFVANLKKPEEREEPLGVQEEHDVGDAAPRELQDLE